MLDICYIFYHLPWFGCRILPNFGLLVAAVISSSIVSGMRSILTHFFEIAFVAPYCDVVYRPNWEYLNVGWSSVM